MLAFVAAPILLVIVASPDDQSEALALSSAWVDVITSIQTNQGNQWFLWRCQRQDQIARA